jgi:hypothetical protein
MKAVRASVMEGAFAGRADTGQPFRFFCTFTETGGPRSAEGREVRAMLDGYEVADLLHAIPSAVIGSDADRQALVRVICLLNRLAAGPAAGNGS